VDSFTASMFVGKLFSDIYSRHAWPRPRLPATRISVAVLYDLLLPLMRKRCVYVGCGARGDASGAGVECARSSRAPTALVQFGVILCHDVSGPGPIRAR
jgi:hypothetical protein